MQPSEPIHKDWKMYTRNWMKTTEIECIYQKLYTNIRIYKQGLENVYQKLNTKTRNWIQTPEKLYTTFKNCKQELENVYQKLNDTTETEYKQQKTLWSYQKLYTRIEKCIPETTEWYIHRNWIQTPKNLYGAIRNCKLEMEKVY